MEHRERWEVGVNEEVMAEAVGGKVGRGGGDVNHIIRRHHTSLYIYLLIRKGWWGYFGSVS